MAKSNKLKNVKAVKQMLNGEHRFQTKKTYYFGNASETAEKAKKREVGDRWTEDLPSGGKIYWEQMDGYRRKSLESWDRQELGDELREYISSFSSCPKEYCTCTAPNPLDEKFRAKMGMCFDCVVTMETKLQVDGKFDEYAKTKMFENVKAYIKDMDAEFSKWKVDIQGNFDFVNGDETMETWKSTNSNALIERMEAEYNEMREMLLTNYNPENLR